MSHPCRHDLLLPLLLAAAAAGFGPAAALGQSFIPNGEFDLAVAPWEDDPAADTLLVWDTPDHDLCGALSGSALAVNGAAAASAYREFGFCLGDVDIGQAYSFGADLRFPANQAANGYAAMFVTFYLGADCTNVTIGSYQTLVLSTIDDGAWIRLEKDVVVPAGSQSASVTIFLTKETAGETLQLRFDGAYMLPVSGYLFADGFANESLCRWSEESP